MEIKDLLTELNEKYCHHRFTKKDLEKSLNFHFDLKGKNAFKLKKEEKWLPHNDDMLTFTISDNHSYYDVTVFYLKTNAKGYLYITEIAIECESKL
jgi:hypothetical protein